MTIVSPSVLFDELEVKRADNSKEKLPDYPAPALTRDSSSTGTLPVRFRGLSIMQDRCGSR